MCCRYVSPEEAELERDYSRILPWWRHPAIDQPNYDARPHSQLPIIRARDQHAVELLTAHWTLLPGRLEAIAAWKYNTINLQVEKLDTPRSMAKQHFKGGRCLVPMKGFYEWPETAAGEKIRAYIYPKDQTTWLAAGLASPFETKAGESGISFGIFTCPANGPMRQLHNRGKNKHRMPAFIHSDDAEDWLFGSSELARSMLDPLPDDEIAAYIVTRNAGNAIDQVKRIADVPWEQLP